MKFMRIGKPPLARDFFSWLGGGDSIAQFFGIKKGYCILGLSPLPDNIRIE